MKSKTSILILLLTFLLVNVGNATAQQKHEYVDLGLPSGTLWATCNVGAAKPWDYGDYYAWGETEPKDTTYSWDTYKYSKSDERGGYKMTKYCDVFGKGYNGYTDQLSTLEKNDDVAYLKWGSNWCMPTPAQFLELFHNCKKEWTTNYYGKGVEGWIFTSKKNDNTIFFPAAGYKTNKGNSRRGFMALFWSSSLDTEEPNNAKDFGFRPDWVYENGSDYRYIGGSVRPVRCNE